MNLAYNPFDFANPISNVNLLVGRMKEMEEIIYYLDNAINAPRPINIALLGRRASGKTSILNVTEFEAKKRGFCTVRINLDEDDAKNQLTFFSKLFDSILTRACESGAYEGKGGKTYDTYLDIINAYIIPDDKTFCPFVFPIQYAKAMGRGNVNAPISDNNFMDDLIKIHEELKIPILLLFDEGNVLANNSVLLQKLRNIFMNVLGYMLVMTGTPDLFPVMDEIFSPIVRQFKKINVSEFSKVDDTLACIRKPMEQLDIDPDEIFDFETDRDVQDIHNLSGGQPYEIQLISHILFRRVQDKRAKTMKLDVSVLEEVLKEIEKGQDIARRPILTMMRKLSKKQLAALGLLCSCNGKATFEQIWGLEYIFRGESLWNKKILEDALQIFVSQGILRVEDDLISFAGDDDFDRIYTKYYAREKDISLNFSSRDINTRWQEELNDFIEHYLNDRLEIFFDRYSTVTMKEGGDISHLIQFITEDSKRDFFVDLAPIAEFVYKFMAQNQDNVTTSIIEVNPQLTWLNIQLAYRLNKCDDFIAIEEGIDQIKSLVGRIADLGGNLVVNKKDVPVVPLSALKEKVLITANERVRHSLARFHLEKMHTAYLDNSNIEDAMFQADLSYQYNPEPDIQASNNLGYVYLSADNLDKADFFLRRAINLCQSNNREANKQNIFPALSNYNLGVVYAERRQFESAQAEFQSCINVVQDLNTDDRLLASLWVPMANDGALIFEEQRSPDLLEVAEKAKAALESILTWENNEMT